MKRSEFDYFDFEYDFERPGWFCYYYQLKEIWSLIKTFKKKNIKILEIGPGNNTVADYLKKKNINIKTLDIDKRTKPDIQGNILTVDLNPLSFEIILCAEVLEHLNFKFFEEALIQLNYWSKNFLILTLPETADGEKKCSEHYWEINYKDYNLSIIKKLIKKYFRIKRTYKFPLWPYQRIFILEKIK